MLIRVSTRHKKQSLNVLLVLVSVAIGILALEGISRVISPLSPGARNLSIEGDSISPVSGNPFRLTAGLVYRQVSSEFDVIVTIDRYGNRVPEPEGTPLVVFLGDSFTFGHGVGDEDTFVFILCKTLNISCGNLGRSGTGTKAQLDTLEHYIETEGWRPRVVILAVLAMTSAFSAGNDLLDNYNAFKYNALELRQSQKNSGTGVPAGEQSNSTTPANYLLRLFRVVLEWSNLARNVQHTIGPWLRSSFALIPETSVYRDALDATKHQFRRFVQMSNVYRFEPRVIVLHPIHDILRGTSDETIQELKGLHDSLIVEGTASAFSHLPTEYYFPLDGHFNSNGSRQVAKFLLGQLRHLFVEVD